MDGKFYYDGKVIHCTREDFNMIHKNYKNDSAGNERMLSYDEVTGGTTSVPVRFKQEDLVYYEIEKRTRWEDTPPSITSTKQFSNWYPKCPRAKALVELIGGRGRKTFTEEEIEQLKGIGIMSRNVTPSPLDAILGERGRRLEAEHSEASS